MVLLSRRERIVQTLYFEFGGWVLVAPLYAVVSGALAAESAILIVVISITVMILSPLYNTAFDILDLRISGRKACDRLHHWRVVHAVLHEVSAILVTMPLIVFWADTVYGERWLSTSD